MIYCICCPVIGEKTKLKLRSLLDTKNERVETKQPAKLASSKLLMPRTGAKFLAVAAVANHLKRLEHDSHSESGSSGSGSCSSGSSSSSSASSSSLTTYSSSSSSSSSSLSSSSSSSMLTYTHEELHWKNCRQINCEMVFLFFCILHIFWTVKWTVFSGDIYIFSYDICSFYILSSCCFTW